MMKSRNERYGYGPTGRFTARGLAARVICIVGTGLLTIGCDQNASNWDWFGARSDAKTRPSASRSGTAAGQKPRQDETDPNARDVEDKVAQYVQNMNTRYDDSYRSNDFNSKIERQNDPNRSERIRSSARAWSERDSSAEAVADPASPPIESASGQTDVPTVRIERPPPGHVDGAGSADSGSPEAPSDDPGKNIAAPGQSPSERRVADSTADSSPDSEPSSQGDGASTVSLAPPVRTSERPSGSAVSVPGKPNERDSAQPDPAQPNQTAVQLANQKHGTEHAPDAKPESNDGGEFARSPAEPSSDGSDDRAADRVADAGQAGATDADRRSGKPPVLSSLNVSAGPAEASPGPSESAPHEDVSEPTRPVVTRAESRADVLSAMIAEQEDKVLKNPNDIEQQYRLRLLYLSAGKDDQALAPIDGTNKDIQEMIQAHLRTLITARSDAGRDPALWANRQLGQLESLVNLVRSRADLQVRRVALVREIEGYGKYDTIDPPHITLGEPALVYVEIDNYRCEKTRSGRYRTLVTARLSLLDHDGRQLWSDAIENIEDISLERLRDFFIGFDVPTDVIRRIGPGDYTLKVEVEDVLAGKMNSNQTRLAVAQPGLQPASEAVAGREETP